MIFSVYSQNYLCELRVDKLRSFYYNFWLVKENSFNLVRVIKTDKVALSRGSGISKLNSTNKILYTTFTTIFEDYPD